MQKKRKKNQGYGEARVEKQRKVFEVQWKFSQSVMIWVWLLQRVFIKSNFRALHASIG